ncbi:MAG: cobyrinate a,c-diamide synthase [Magnetococcus sp. MYC-9]
MQNTPGFLISACQSHTGKTTVTLAMMAALRAAGIPVAPFKAGPDFIDPQWHAAICRRPSYTLDTCMVGAEESRSLLAQKRRAGEMAVVEGVMGLYDGKTGVGGTGSTADLARTLGLPVVLVVNAKGMAGSMAPLVAGFTHFAQGFSMAGILANRVGSARHAQILRQALQEHDLPPLLGWMTESAAIGLGERHLGLLMPQDQPPPAESALLEALTLDLALLQERIRLPPNLATPSPTPPDTLATPLLAGKRIAVARDAAFCFVYPANLEQLRAWGATLHLFSPLAGEPLPAGTDALWLPGGYPELHAASLAHSASWPDIRQAVGRGLPVLAECGGMMALGESLTDHAGHRWPMAGVLPIHTRMTNRLAGLGYRQESSGVRGHEFHHSIRDPSGLEPAFQMDRGDAGVRLLAVRASYIHWYFPSHPEACARWFSNDPAPPHSPMRHRYATGTQQT